MFVSVCLELLSKRNTQIQDFALVDLFPKLGDFLSDGWWIHGTISVEGRTCFPLQCISIISNPLRIGGAKFNVIAMC